MRKKKERKNQEEEEGDIYIPEQRLCCWGAAVLNRSCLDNTKVPIGMGCPTIDQQTALRISPDKFHSIYDSAMSAYNMILVGVCYQMQHSGASCLVLKLVYVQ